MHTSPPPPPPRNCFICKTFLRPLQLGLVTNASLVYLFYHGLPVNYNARKNGGNNLTLDPTKISLWASHSLSQSLFHPTHASPGCLPLICQLYSQKFNHSLAMNLPGYFHPISVTPCPTSRYMHCFLDFQDLPYTQCLVLPAKKNQDIFSLASRIWLLTHRWWNVTCERRR